MARCNFPTLVAQCAALALVAGLSPLSASELPETDDTSPDSNPLLAIAAAKRLRPLYHDQAPAAIERTADTIMGVLRHPSIPLRCIEATLAWNGSSFFVKAASMTGLARHFTETRLCVKSGAKPVIDVICAKSQCARGGHDAPQTTPSAPPRQQA